MAQAAARCAGVPRFRRRASQVGSRGAPSESVMRQFTESVLNELLERHGPPCVSLYQPTHRHYPGTAVDRIYFRNLLKAAEASLRRKYPSRDVKSLLSVPRTYEADTDFWNHQADGLAVFASADSF